MTQVKAQQDYDAQWAREAVSPRLPSYTVAKLPPAGAFAGHIIYVSNGATGSPCLAYSNGTSWLRVLIGAAVAAL